MILQIVGSNYHHFVAESMQVQLLYISTDLTNFPAERSNIVLKMVSEHHR